MVDVSASIDDRTARNSASGSTVRQEAGHVVSVVVHRDIGAALDAYEALAGQAVFTPPQGPAWIRTWTAEARADAVVATLSVGGVPAFALALEVVRSGPFRVARFMGASHANGNFAPVVGTAPRLRRADMDRVVAEIARTRPDIDMIALERMVAEHDGIANPLLALPGVASPNISLAVDLDGGFDALLKRSSGKRKRKKHRSQIRKFEAAGGYRLIEARTHDEIDRVLDAFYAMKHIRLTKMGVEDVFGEPHVQSFFRRLFQEADGPRPDFVLHALEVGGSIRAVTGSSRTANAIICEFGAILEDELANASPGDFLFFESIKSACDEGLALYDFSVGDELYKRLWCDVEAIHTDVLVALTAKGRVLAATTRGKTRLKAWVKNNQAIWSMIKRLRRRDAQPAKDQVAEGADD